MSLNKDAMESWKSTARDIQEFLFVDGRKKKGEIPRTESELRKFLESISVIMWEY